MNLFLSLTSFLPIACETPISAPILDIKTNALPNQVKNPAVPTYSKLHAMLFLFINIVFYYF